MNSRRTLTASVLMMLLLASNVVAAGPGPGSRDWKEVVELKATKFADKGTFGYCQIGNINGVEMLGVRVFADMPDDKMLIVQIVTKEGTFEVGTMKMFLGSAALVLYENGFAPSQAFPLDRIQSVVVRDVDNPLLVYTWQAAGLPTR